MNETGILLEAKGLRKSFGEGAGRVDVLQGIDLRIQKGQTLAVVGPSGSGKSTLLHLLGALDRPTSGSVALCGKDFSSLGDEELARIRNQEIGFMFQMHYLLPSCTVLENVLVPAIPCGIDHAVQQRADELLERAGLSARRSHLPGQLSGGERQRVAAVRALINQPQLVLADEPTGSLDRVASEALVDLLLTLNRGQGMAMILVTHSDSIAERMQSKVILRDGRIVD